MTGTWQDVRYAFRAIHKEPLFCGLILLILALAIGGNTAVFTVVNQVLLRPLPFDSPDRLVWMWGRFSLNDQASISPPDFLDYRAQVRSLERFAALQGFRGMSFSLAGEGEAFRVSGALVTHGFFETFRAAPALGRPFTAADEQPGGEPPVMLSFGLWQRRFGGDPGIVGRELQINGEPSIVTGVMPRGFAFPPSAEMWMPVRFGTPETSVRRFHFLHGVGRLRPGVSLPAVQRELNAIAARLEEQYPDSNKTWGLRLVPLQDVLLGDVRLPLLVIQAAVALVLAVACANVATLMLARGNRRRREIAIRRALGAGRIRILRQLMTESLVLSLAGGAVGLLVGSWVLDVLRDFAPAGLYRVETISMDTGTLAFTCVCSLATGIVFGLIPAFQSSFDKSRQSLADGGPAGMSREYHRVSSTLITAEIGVSLCLLIGAGLLLRSYARLLDVDPGYRTDQIITTSFRLESRQYTEDERRAAFVRGVTGRIRNLPGVEAVGVTTALPLKPQGNSMYFRIEGRPALPRGESLEASLHQVNADYFQTMRIPLVQGRSFTAQDRPGTPFVILVNEPFARDHFAGEPVLGRRLVLQGEPPYTAEIVGIVGGIRQYSLAGQAMPTMYLHNDQFPGYLVNLVVATRSDPSQIAGAVRAAVSEFDREVALEEFTTMKRLVTNSVAWPRFRTLLLSAFAGLALALALAGIYGVMAYSVSQRTRELGVRVALGAGSRNVLMLVLRRAAWIAAFGIGAGVGGALLLTRVLETLLFEVTPGDPATFVAVALGTWILSLLAGYIPARRATRTDPIVALRQE
jgi:putative ABC transport system permease protein